MSSLETIGYLASALVLATFCMRSMLLLRIMAITSNVAFMAYGYLGQLTPVLLLHGLLMLVNAYHIGRVFRGTSAASPAAPRKPADNFANELQAGHHRP